MSPARGPVHISVDVIVNADAQTVWDAMTEWEAQGRWMLGTAVKATVADGRGVGGEIEAFTGAGRLGFLDTMVITTWDPPRRCDVLHTGRVVRGTGTFEVVDLPAAPDGSARSRFVWAEDLDLPLGVIGRLGFPVVRPFFTAGVRRSLVTFSRLVEICVLPTARA